MKVAETTNNDNEFNVGIESVLSSQNQPIHYIDFMEEENLKNIIKH